jgi:hypothetical protein
VDCGVLPDERTRGMKVLVLLPAQGSSGGTCGEIPSPSSLDEHRRVCASLRSRVTLNRTHEDPAGTRVADLRQVPQAGSS